MTDAQISPDQFAALVAQASDEQLRQGLESNREEILGEIFRRMPESFDPSRGEARACRASSGCRARTRRRADAYGRGIGPRVPRARPEGSEAILIAALSDSLVSEIPFRGWAMLENP